MHDRTNIEFRFVLIIIATTESYKNITILYMFFLFLKKSKNNEFLFNFSLVYLDTKTQSQ